MTPDKQDDPSRGDGVPEGAQGDLPQSGHRVIRIIGFDNHMIVCYA